jgi:hypothetical protein
MHSTSRVFADEPAATTASGDASLPSLLPLITEDAVAGVVVYPQQFFDSPVLHSLPVEVVTADLTDQLGVDLRNVEFVIAFLEHGPTQPLSLGMIVKFAQSQDWRRLPDVMLRDTVFGQLDGRPYRKGKGPLDMSLLQLDARTLIIAPDETLRRMLATRETMPADESIVQQLSHGIGKSLDIHVTVNTKSFRPLVALQLEQLGGGNEAWQAFAQLLDEMERVELRARLSREFAVGLVMQSTSAEGGRLQTLWSDWNAALQNQLERATDTSSMMSSASQIVGPIELSRKRTIDRIQRVAQYVHRSICEQLSGQTVRVNGNAMQWRMRGDATTQTTACASVAMLLGSSVQTTTVVIDRWQSMDDMQRLSNAMLAYARHHDRFPARANFAADDRPLLSWRVHVLPFLGYRQLYEQFHLDEPWDSMHNQALIRLMPPVYQNARRPFDYRTTYIVPVGTGTMFEGSAGLLQRDLHDGPANTLMLVEADEEQAVVWTRPDDLRYDQHDPWNGLGKLRADGFLGARADGKVSFYVRSLNAIQLDAYFSRDGGETQLH